MRLYDLYCKAGGTTKGYQEAGFEVIGVDRDPQPRYCGDGFIRADAISFLEAGDFGPSPVVGFHASPPCQAFSPLAVINKNPEEYPRLIEPTRDLLRQIGLPYVIENVEWAPLIDPVLLCGSMFGLGTTDGYLRRHRLFEATFPIAQLPCFHAGRAVGVYGHGGGNWGGRHRSLSKDGAQQAMGISWMLLRELAEAIPPAYTRYIGRALRHHAEVVGIR